MNGKWGEKNLLVRHNVNEQSFDIVALHRPKIYAVESWPKKMGLAVCSRFYPTIKGNMALGVLFRGR